MRLLAKIFFLLCINALTGCVDQSQIETKAIVHADLYETHIHGWLAPSCASLDCHGQKDRPLHLYWKFGLRNGERSEELRESELQWNARALLDIDPGADVDSHLLLKKPLSEELGGFAHVGGTIWNADHMKEIACVRAYLQGKRSAIERLCIGIEDK